MDCCPEHAYKRFGDVAYVMFPCGSPIDAVGDTINLTMAVQTAVFALATGNVSMLLTLAENLGGPRIAARSDEPGR